MVKFDLYPNDKYDKWFEVSSPNIRLPAAAAAAPPAAAAAVPAANGDADKTPSKDKIKAEIKSPVIVIKKTKPLLLCIMHSIIDNFFDVNRSKKRI